MDFGRSRIDSRSVTGARCLVENQARAQGALSHAFYGVAGGRRDSSNRHVPVGNLYIVPLACGSLCATSTPYNLVALACSVVRSYQMEFAVAFSFGSALGARGRPQEMCKLRPSKERGSLDQIPHSNWLVHVRGHFDSHERVADYYTCVATTCVGLRVYLYRMSACYLAERNCETCSSQAVCGS